MKITIESTTKIVTLETSNGPIQARVWQGETENGIPVHCFVTRIAPEVKEGDVDFQAVTAEFERHLQRCADPRPTVEAIPLRFIID